MNHPHYDRGIAEVAVVHAGVTIYRVIGAHPSIGWSFTTCAECALREDGTAVPHAFDVRRLPNPKRLDLETRDAAVRTSSICEILRYGTEAGAIASSRCEAPHYMLAFAVPYDTPGGYVRAIFALYGLPRGAADAFFGDLSLAIRHGRHDLLLSEERAVENAVAVAFDVAGCDDTYRTVVEAELISLLGRGARAA